MYKIVIYNMTQLEDADEKDDQEAKDKSKD